jgi:hypothetical protein
VDDGLVQSLRLAGATEADIAQVVAERGEAPPDEPDEEGADDASAFAVEPDNWDNWLIFLSVSTQWVWASMGMGGAARVALNYSAVESALRMQGIKRKRWPGVFADLRHIEQAVLVADNDMRARAPKGGRPRT